MQWLEMTDPVEKVGRKGTEEREVFKHHYKEIKWNLMKDLWKLVSIFHHTNGLWPLLSFPNLLAY